MHSSSRPPSTPAGALKRFPALAPHPTRSHASACSGYLAELQNWFGLFELVDEIGRVMHVTRHELRHANGTRLVSADVPPHIVQVLLDHPSLAPENYEALGAHGQRQELGRVSIVKSALRASQPRSIETLASRLKETMQGDQRRRIELAAVGAELRRMRRLQPRQTVSNEQRGTLG